MQEVTIKARIVSPGMAIGKAFLFTESATVSNDRQEINVETELQRFDSQVNHIAAELSELFERISREIDVKDAEIIQTQRMILEDEGFKKKVINLISEEFIPVEKAVDRVMQSFSQRLKASSNELMRERALDFIDLTKYFRHPPLEKLTPREVGHPKETILIVGDLFPSVVLQGRQRAVRAILAQSAAPTSHAAILARSFGIPVLIAPADLSAKMNNGTPLIVDALAGNIILYPAPQTVVTYKKRLAVAQKTKHDYQKIKKLPAKTTDSVEISLGVNIERLDELHLFSAAEIDNVGLFRTEFLFMFDQNDFPSFEQQVNWYKKVVRYMNGKPVTFRVLDVGGDKFLPYFSMGRQSNPYLGLRAHRVFQYHPEILETQLRAILEAAKIGPVQILYPMINTLEEIEYLNDILTRIATDDARFKTGIMVETPAAVFMIKELLPFVDFVSIGTNDLVQYALTVDRNNENVMTFYKPMHPLILRMLKQIVDAAETVNKPLTICGEIASDPRWTPLLLGLGIRSLSMAPLLIPPIKSQILSLNMEQCRKLVQKALQTNYEKDVLGYLDVFFAEKKNHT